MLLVGLSVRCAGVFSRLFSSEGKNKNLKGRRDEDKKKRKREEDEKKRSLLTVLTKVKRRARKTLTADDALCVSFVGLGFFFFFCEGRRQCFGKHVCVCIVLSRGAFIVIFLSPSSAFEREEVRWSVVTSFFPCILRGLEKLSPFDQLKERTGNRNKGPRKERRNTNR